MTSTLFGITLFDELARHGVRDVVVSPGSRSAPLALAAARHPELAVYVRVDERSAGFFALGLVRGRGGWPPAVLVCTSGTAAANYHPAVLEAAAAGVPLLVLTADRPPELRDVGANQTARQEHLYGHAVRWFSEVGSDPGLPDPSHYWRSVASRAVAETGSTSSPPGPVHLNCLLRDPLIGEGHERLEPDARGGAPFTVVAHPQADAPDGFDTYPVIGAITATSRGLLLLGDGAAASERTLELADHLAWPVLAEPTSGLRRPPALRAFHWLLGDEGFLDAHRPDVVLTAGRPVLSRRIDELLARVPIHVVCDHHGRWWDPVRTAHAIVPAALGSWVAAVAEAIPRQRDRGWLEAWQRADAAASRALDDVLDAEEASNLAVARDLAAALPSGALLLAGSSLPVRDLNEAMVPRGDVRVIGNRGLSGIDGFISMAVGAALVHPGTTAALAGDLTLLHDAGGLLFVEGERRPDLVVIVVDNRGGGIFGHLPYARLEEFEGLFATPPEVDLAALAAAYGWGFTETSDVSQARAAAAARGGSQLVVVRTDRTRERSVHAEVQAAVHAALRGQ